MEKRLAVLQKDDRCVAGVFSSLGLFSVNLPTSSIAEAIASVDANDIPRANDPQDLRVLEMVFAIMDGKEIDTSQLRFDFTGLTMKQIKVLTAAHKIPYGHTRTYGAIASEAGLPNAARFVGNVMANNRFPPIIPCHRVVASNGPGGYGAGDGIPTKIALLEAEGVRFAE